LTKTCKTAGLTPNTPEEPEQPPEKPNTADEWSGGKKKKELDKLLQAPETAFQTAQEEANPSTLTFQFLHDGEDKRAERQGSGVIPCPAQRREDGEGRHVIWFLKGPVIRSKRPGQRHLPQRYDEIGQPEEHEGVVDLEYYQVLVVIRLSPIESEQAAGVRAQTGDVGGVKFLEETGRHVSTGAHSALV
uniref:Uncharacterized protein n=1 Tax=Leptobrachium leishanense TaxID=445787 RepID=A0A8C5M1J9_9ANUR